MPVLVTILILATSGLASQAFAETVITMNTDRDVYDHESTIILTGHVEPVDIGGSAVSILCKSPGGAGVCGIEQVQPNSDGDFSVMFNTSSCAITTMLVYWFTNIIVTGISFSSTGKTVPVIVTVSVWS